MTAPSEMSLKTRVLNRGRALLMAPLLEPGVRRLVSGSIIGSLRSRIPPNHYQYPQPCRRRVQTQEGWVMDVDIGTLLGWAAYFGLTDPGLDAFYRLIRPGMVVFDVGANIGEVVLRAGKLVDPEGVVIAFEPHPETYQELETNLSLNPGAPVQAHNLALGREKGALTMVRTDARNPGGQRVSSRAVGGEEAVEIRASTLDAFCRENHIQRLDLLKIDTEGFEAQVLEGGRETLRALQPTVFLELDEDLLSGQGATVSGVLGFLQELGYGVRHALTGEALDPEGSFQGMHFDGIATVR